MQQSISRGKDAPAVIEDNSNESVVHGCADQNSNEIQQVPHMTPTHTVRESITHVVGIFLSIVLNKVS